MAATKEYMCLWWAQVPAELRKLREDEKLCDITFVLNGSLEYKMHALVMVCASSQFRNRLNKSGWQNTYFFDNVNVECFRHLLNYVYGCNLVLNEKNVKDMLYLATMLSIDTAILHCEEFCNTLPSNTQSTEKCTDYQESITATSNHLTSHKHSIEPNPLKNKNVENVEQVTDISHDDSMDDENSTSNIEMTDVQSGVDKDGDEDSGSFDSASKELLGRSVKSEDSENQDEGNSNASSRTNGDENDRHSGDLGDKTHSAEKPKGKSLEDICAQLASSRQFAQSSTDCRIVTPQKQKQKSVQNSDALKSEGEVEKDCSIYDFVDVMPLSSSGTCSPSASPSSTGGIYSNSSGNKGKNTLALSVHMDLRACAIRREKDKSKYISTLLGLRSQDNESPLDMDISESPSLESQIAPSTNSPVPNLSTSTPKTKPPPTPNMNNVPSLPKPVVSTSGSCVSVAQTQMEPTLTWSTTDGAVTWSQPDNNGNLPLSKSSDSIPKILDSLASLADNLDPNDSTQKSVVSINDVGQNVNLLNPENDMALNQTDVLRGIDNPVVNNSLEQTEKSTPVGIPEQNKPPTTTNEVACTSATSTPANAAQSLYPFLNQIGSNLVPVYLPFPNMPNLTGTKDDFSHMIPSSLAGIGGGMQPLQNMVKSVVNDNLPLPQTLQQLNGALAATQAAIQQSQSVAALQQTQSVGDITSQVNFPQITNFGGQNFPPMSFMNNSNGNIAQSESLHDSSQSALPVGMQNSQTQTSNSSSESVSEEDGEEQSVIDETSAVSEASLQHQLQSVLSQQLGQGNGKNLCKMDGSVPLFDLGMNNSLQAAANLNAAMSLYTCMMLPNAAGVPQPTVLLPPSDGHMMQPNSTSFAQPVGTQSSCASVVPQQNGALCQQSNGTQPNLATFLPPSATQSPSQNTANSLVQTTCGLPPSSVSPMIQSNMTQSATTPMLPPPLSQPNIIQPGLLPTNISNTALMAQATLTHTNITPTSLPNVHPPCSNTGAMVPPNLIQAAGNLYGQNPANSTALIQPGMNPTNDVSLLTQNGGIGCNPLGPANLNQLNGAPFLPTSQSGGTFLPTDFGPLLPGKTATNMTKPSFNMGAPFLGPGNFPLASALQQMGQFDLSNLCKDMPTIDNGQARSNGQHGQIPGMGTNAPDGVPSTPGIGPAVNKHLFDCPVCGKGFPNTKQRAVHMRIHSRTEHKPFVCDMCGFRTKYADRLKIHKRLQHTHKGVKPFKCPYCPYATSLKGNCRKHVMTKHPGLEVTVEQVMPI